MTAGGGAGSGAGLGDLLFGAEADDVDVVVHAGDEAWTRRRLQDRAIDIACALADAGVAAGTAVGVMLPNGADVVAALFGVWRAGAVYVPLNPRLTDDEVRHVLASVSPAALVTVGDHADRLAALSGVPLAVLEQRRVAALPPPGRPPAEPTRHGDDVALVQFTSGTTGRPKPVLLTHSGVLALMDGVVRKLRPPQPAAGAGGTAKRAPMPNLVPVSLSLWAGLYNVLFALRVGAPVVVMDGFDTRTFVDLVRRHGIRSTVLPPAAMAMLSDDTAVDDLAPLRYVRSITAPLSPLQARRFRDRFGIVVLNCYGQTEIGGEIVGWTAADAREHPDKLGAVGRPHEGVSLRVVDDTGTDVPPGEVGELWVRAPALAAGYAGGTDLSDRLSPDGWFRTGDVGRVDADGFVWIEGRVSDMVNRGGLKVFPAEVEEVLRLSPDVADVAVVGVPDDRLGEVPWAFVVGEADAAGLEALCRRHLAPYKVPVRFEPTGELPRNEVGKVLKADLARRAAASR